MAVHAEARRPGQYQQYLGLAAPRLLQMPRILRPATIWRYWASEGWLLVARRFRINCSRSINCTIWGQLARRNVLRGRILAILRLE